MTVPNSTLKSLKKLLHSDDPDRVAQGAELAVALDDDALIATLLQGGGWHETDVMDERCGQLVIPPALRPRGQSDDNARLALMTILARSTAPAARTFCQKVTSLYLTTSRVDFSLFTGFSHVERLRIHSATEVRNPGALASLPSLRSLAFRWCHGLTSLDGITSPSLQQLSVGDALCRIGAPGALPSLRELDLGRASMLDDLHGLSALGALETLRAEGASNLTDLSGLSGLTRLRSLSLTHAKKLLRLDGIERSAGLQSLTVTGSLVRSIEPLRGLTALESIDLSGAPIASLDPLGAHPALARLNLVSTRVESLAALSGSASLSDVRVSNSPVRTLDGLHAEALAHVEFDNCRDLVSLAALRKYSGFRVIHWANLPALRALDGLEASAPQLTRLHLLGCDALADITALYTAANLRELSLANALALPSFAGIERCTRLQKLSVTHARALRNLSALAPLRALLDVSLFGASALTDVGVLGGLSALQTLDLRGAEKVTRIDALGALTNLSRIALYGSGVTRAAVPRHLRDLCTWKPAPDLTGSTRASNAPLRTP